MSKSYKVAKKTINMGDKKGQTVYSVRPYSYGTLTTEEVANQIAVESTATPADVKAVLDRYAYYVKENLKKGYDIELLGFGKLFIRFITGKAVEDESKANAKLIKSLVPSVLLSPSCRMVLVSTICFQHLSNSSSTVMRRRTTLLAVLPMRRRSLLQATLRMVVRTPVERTQVERTLAAARILAVQVLRTATMLISKL